MIHLNIVCEDLEQLMVWCSKKVGVCRHTTEELRKKGRGRKFSLRSRNIVSFSNKGDTNELIMRKGARFQRVERAGAATTKTNSRSQFSTVWFLGRSRSDKDKETTNRPGRRKRAALRRITLPYRAYNVRTLICIRVASCGFVCSEAMDGARWARDNQSKRTPTLSSEI